MPASGWTTISRSRSHRTNGSAILKSLFILMRFRHALLIALLGLGAGIALLAQRPFKEWDAIEYNHNIPIPDDSNTKTDWVRARLRYPDIYGYPFKQLYYQGREFPG